MKKAPWESKGRWYRFFCESNGTTVTLTRGDLADAEISSGVLKLPKDYRIVNFCVDSDNNVDAAADVVSRKRYYADGKEGIYLPTAGQFTNAYAYVYAYRE